MMMVIVVLAVVICMHQKGWSIGKGSVCCGSCGISVSGDGVLAGRRSHLAGLWVVSSEAGQAVERWFSGVCCCYLTGDVRCGGDGNHEFNETGWRGCC